MMKSKRIMSRRTAGFTLTEMLVTTLLLVLASTLLVTGIPVAIDTYQKTVNSANAQVAMTTTLTVLRSEYGLTTETRTIGEDVYYRTEEGIWATIRNAADGEDYRGLVKVYVDTDASNGPNPAQTLGVYPLVPNATLTGANKLLYLNVGSIQKEANDVVTVTNVAVRDAGPADANRLASLDSYKISTRFAN